MNDLGWRADGIERAMAAGGVVLEVYNRPGFEAGKAVRRSSDSGPGSGFPIDRDPYPDEWEEDRR